MNLSNCRVVLVQPHFPGNLGSVARAMRNFGLRDLVLVAPYARTDDSEAIRLATHGAEILRNARIVADFGTAIADCQIALATSALTEGIIRDRFYGTPDELLPQIVEALPNGPCALVFGPEPSGLSNAEVTRCHGLIHIPTDPEHASLNLAQSVGICLYELRKAWLHARERKKGRAEPMPPLEMQERMFARLQAGLEGIHFLFGSKRDQLMHAVRHLISRAKPRENEVRVLLGLARQMLYVSKAWREAIGMEPLQPAQPEDSHPFDPDQLSSDADL